MNEVCLTIQTNKDRSELLLGMTGRARERTEGRRGRVSFLLDVQGGPEHFLKLLVANLYIMTIKLQIILKQNSPGRPRPCPAWTWAVPAPARSTSSSASPARAPRWNPAKTSRNSEFSNNNSQLVQVTLRTKGCYRLLDLCMVPCCWGPERGRQARTWSPFRSGIQQMKMLFHWFVGSSIGLPASNLCLGSVLRCRLQPLLQHCLCSCRMFCGRLRSFWQGGRSRLSWDCPRPAPPAGSDWPARPRSDSRPGRCAANISVSSQRMRASCEIDWLPSLSFIRRHWP